MHTKFRFLSSALLFICSQLSFAASEQTQLAVWANEAIIATYTYDYKNYVQEQKEIAKYFTSEGWITFTKALNASKLPDSVQKNNYFVTSVATQPPIVTNIDANHWKAVMPILVVYKNPAYQQQQNLNISITFTKAPSGQGVRGLSIMSLQSTVGEVPCVCKG